MGAFAPSLLEWVGSSKAMALQTLPSPPGYVPPVAMLARVGSEYPSLPLHGATCWLGILFMFLPATKGKQTTLRKGECAHAYIYGRRYICLYFLWSAPRVDLGFHNTRGVLYRNTQLTGLGYGRGIFLQRPVRGLGFPQHTRISLSVTHQNRVCPVSIDCVRVWTCA